MKALSEDESAFVQHYSREVVTGIQTGSIEAGAAMKWLLDNGIVTTLMQSFEYAEEESNEDFIRWITDAPLPPFKPAWSSKAQFETRVFEILAIYPQLKKTGSAIPGFSLARP
jgi:hypothetical protein